MKKAQVLAAEAAPQMGDQGLIAEHQAMQTSEAVASATSAAPATLPTTANEFNLRENLSKKEQRQMKKEARKLVWKQAKQNLLRKNTASDNTLLLVLIAIFIPPLAMYLYEGDITTRFWISLLLTALGISSLFLFSYFGILPAIVYTIYIIVTNS